MWAWAIGQDESFILLYFLDYLLSWIYWLREQMKSSINLSQAYDVGCCESGLWHHPATSWSIWWFCSSIFPLKLYLYTNFVVCHVYYTFPIFSPAYLLCNSLIINHLKTTKRLNASFNSSYITGILCLSTKSCPWLEIFPIAGASLGFEWLVEFWNCLRFSSLLSFFPSMYFYSIIFIYQNFNGCSCLHINITKWRNIVLKQPFMYLS